jgi:autotransporter-associated beta strand protein
LSVTANWLDVGNNVLVFTNGVTVTFNDNGSNNVPVALSGALQPGAFVVDASENYTFNGSGSLAGIASLTKSGNGALTLTTTNTYSAGTFLNAGTLALSGPSAGGYTANSFALGSGPVTFQGGTLQLYGYNLADNINSFGTFTNDSVVAPGQTGTILTGPRYTFAGKLTGTGTLNFLVDYVRGDVSGDWTAFTGLINVSNINTSTDDFRVANAAGFPNAPGSYMAAGGGSGAGAQNSVTWRVGSLNTSATNAAVISGATSLIKVGSGVWTLTGANSHTGTTTVSNGTLLVHGNCSAANGVVTVATSASLGGNGTLGGATTILAGGKLAPGASIGAITFTNALTLAGTTIMEISHTPLTNDMINKAGTLTFGGALQVTNVSGTLATGDSFKLFNASSYAGSFSSIALATLGAGLAWTTNTLATTGTISVTNTTALTPTNLVFLVAGNTLTLSWPASHKGWTLRAQTNSLTTGITSIWSAVPGSTVTNLMVFPINPANPTVFFRLSLP